MPRRGVSLSGAERGGGGAPGWPVGCGGGVQHPGVPNPPRGRGVGTRAGLRRAPPPPAALSSQDRRDLRVLEAAWHLTEEAGAASSVVTAAAAESIRARRAATDRAGVVAAGPRASMWLLSALPVAGPLAALLVGLTPGQLYGTGPAQAAAAVGLLLTALGWSWSRGLPRRALPAGRTGGGARAPLPGRFTGAEERGAPGAR